MVLLMIGTIEQKPLDDKEINEVSFLNGRQFILKKVGAKWTWQNFTDGQYHLMFKEALNQPAKEIIKTDSYHFYLSRQWLLYHSTDSLNADIYQTVRE
jgi:hypothetical protein